MHPSDPSHPRRAYEDEMSAGDADMRRGAYASARMHFGRAHGLGHEVRCRHVMAHRRLIEVGWRSGNLAEALNNAWLIAAVYVFDRPAAQG